MKKFRLALIGLTFSTLFGSVSIISGLDTFEIFVSALEELEFYEVDEFIIPAFIFCIFLLLDLIIQIQNHQSEIEKIKIYKAMLTSTHHVLNNFLNKMQVFKITAEKTQDFPEDILKLYDEIINDAVVQISALSSISQIDETSIIESVSPQPASNSNTW